MPDPSVHLRSDRPDPPPTRKPSAQTPALFFESLKPALKFFLPYQSTLIPKDACTPLLMRLSPPLAHSLPNCP